MTRHLHILFVGLFFIWSLAGCSHSRGTSSRTHGDSTSAKSAPGVAPETKPSPNEIGFREQPPAGQQVAILAGGCFWGMEEILRKVPGVLKTEVGYTGGHVPSPSYEDLKGGRSGHAEAVKIVFDPSKVTYEQLLSKWFFRMHDPTTKDRQGNDVGSQYRSAIFYTSQAQRKVALAVKQRVDQSGKWPAPVVTEVTPAQVFTPAEGYHQDYLQKNPGGYTCHYLRSMDSF